jgi:predicted Fe-Mo cluster-binding NifX family protein
MKIAIPVKDEALTFFGNAGHTPKFALYEMSGAGMFRSFKLEAVIDNPRTDLDHEHDEDHACQHDHNDAEHIAQHEKMGTALHACQYLVAKRACKNTVNSMKANGISVVKYSGDGLKSEDILRELATQFQ